MNVAVVTPRMASGGRGGAEALYRGLVDAFRAAGHEAAWLGVYAVASGLYKLFVAAVIIVFVSGQLLIVGAVLAVIAVVLWFVVPAVRFVAYLTNDPELDRNRPRAIATTLAALALVIGAVGVIPAPRSIVLTGRAESMSIRPITLGADGFLDRTAEPGAIVSGDDEIAIAIAMEKMGGDGPYPFALGAQDQYLSLLMTQAAETGETVRSTKQPWASS